jgi:hypothetical protein
MDVSHGKIDLFGLDTLRRLAHVLVGEQRFALANRIPLRRDMRWSI